MNVDKKIEQVQHVSNAIIDASEDIDLTGMARVKALSYIMEFLVMYEIKQNPKERKRILGEYEMILRRRLEPVIMADFNFDNLKTRV